MTAEVSEQDPIFPMEKKSCSQSLKLPVKYHRFLKLVEKN
jgi:hypothetical protein